ncbi:MAG: UvrD-helicase domain-containing protein [Microscillaceae bacterium]|nr:UvrD-helicase domain-containing protein [Microscillaceae bacterium]
MIEKRFKIYSSSAGSGKTYTLSKEYLKLALQTDNPHYFKNVLAITFTNDAANEMKSRILDALKAFAYPENLSEKERAKAQVLLSSIAEELGEKQAVITARAQKVFAKIIYNYADFAVSTIDSFVNKVVNAFTRELDIPYNYEVDLDTEQLLQTAIDRVLEKVGHENKEQLSEFVIDWVLQKADEGKNWSRVAHDLVEFSKDLMNEGSYPFITPLRELTMHDFKQISRQIQDYMQNLEKECRQIAQKGYDLILAHGLEGSFIGGNKASVASYFRKNAEEFDPEKRANNLNYMQKALHDDKWYKEKNNAAIDQIKPQLRNYILQIEAIKEQEARNYQLFQALLPHLYKLALIQEIELELLEVKKENNAIHISDTNKKIAEIIATEPVPYIYERVGEKYKHILIDEFQDTSVLQWENLLPLIENNLAEASFNLIVGDSKQAIYRWRGGEMEQLVYLFTNRISDLLRLSSKNSPFLEERYEIIRQNYLPARLNHNYRSTREVIQFNNDFFRVIVESDFGLENELLSLIYDESAAQQIPEQNTKSGGHIQIDFLEKGDLYNSLNCERVLEIIQKALEDGFELHEIAVLTRNNIHGKEIASFLKSRQIEVLSQTSLLLSSDDKIRFLITLLKVIHRPEDKLSKSEALYLFYKVVKNIVPDAETNQEIREIVEQSILVFYEKLSEEGFSISFVRLQSLNIYELVDKLIGIFHLYQEQARPEYLFRFLDVILQFNLQKNTTLGDFLDFWEEKKNSLSINTPKDLQAVTVTTIHKSKGLEYEVVILPFADWSFVPRSGQTMWVTLEDNLEPLYIPGTDKYLQTGLVQINQKLADTALAEQHHSEMQKTFIENFNMLYVAFTRAISRLYILCKNTEFDSKNDRKGVNYLIYLYLKLSDRWDEALRSYVLFEGDKAPEKRQKEENEHIFYIDEFVSTDIHRKIKVQRASKKNKQQLK